MIILFHSCISSDLERVREGLGDKVSFIFQFLAQFIAGFTIGFVYGWKLALVMMSLTPLLAVCGAFLSKVSLDYILSTTQLYRNLEKRSAVEMFATFFQLYRKDRPRGYKTGVQSQIQIKCNDWLLADTCPQSANHCALF